jgi:hypothetical protein
MNSANSRLAELAARRKPSTPAPAPAAKPTFTKPIAATRQAPPSAKQPVRSTIPKRPAPPAPGRVAPTPNRIDRAVRPLNDRAVAEIGQRATRDNADDLDAGLSSTSNFIDTTHLDPGPDASDVPFGFNCGSCSKFLALNDPRRDDPAFMESYLSSNSHCPLALIQTVKVRDNKSPDELVRRAPDVACSKYKINKTRATPEFLELLEHVRGTTRGEFDVLSAQLDGIHREKLLEDRYGYRLGEIVKIRVAGVAHAVNARVIGFKGKNIILQAKVDGKLITVRQPIAEARVVE